VADHAPQTEAYVHTKLLAIVLIAGYVSRALADEPAQPPPPLMKRAVAVGYAGSIIGFDVPRNGDDRVDISGLGVLGRWDLHPDYRGWGVQLGYAVKDASIGPGGELSLDQAAAHAYYAWEGGGEDDSLRLRFYLKAGVSRTAFEETNPSTGTSSDDAFGPSLGLGVEWGARRWGVVFDVGWTFVDVELIPAQKESLTVSAGFIGLAYCF
jgi:hypothetical protein